MKKFTCLLAVVAVVCVSSARVQATDTVWTGGSGNWADGANWDHGHGPGINDRGTVSADFVAPLVVDINAPAEALELFVADSLGLSTTLNINSSLIVGRNSFGASLFVNRNNTADKAVINVNGAAGGSLWVGDPGAPTTDPNYRQGTFIFNGESEWNITGGADVTMSLLRGKSAKPVDFNISEGSTVLLGRLRTWSPIDTFDVIGSASTLTIDFTETSASPSDQLGQVTDWWTNGNNNDTVLTGGTRIRGFEADGVTQAYLYMLPLDGVDPINGVVFSTVPEPTTVALLGLGLIGFVTARRRRS